MSKFDFGVFIGRFQPLHVGHEHVIARTLEQVERLIVLVGSANVARDPRNPFTYDEREAMLRSAFRHEVAQGRLIIAPIDDHVYSDTAWVVQVQRTVRALVLEHGNGHGFQNHGLRDFRVALTGYGKDASSFYLKLFPEWENLQVDSQYGTFSSSDVRVRYFQRIAEVPASILSAGVADFLREFMLGDMFKALLEEAEFLAAYPAQWGKGPFVTADAVVVQSGHILLVERGRAPGKGLLALPGGFVNPAERIRDAAIRELREETAISDGKGQIPPAMLASFIEDARTRVFDAPNRSMRGRIITHAFLFRLPERRKLFSVKGGDDAAHAQWYRFGDLSPEMLFEDHWAIIEEMADL
ncbi:bifunctional nicotinamide-nucleotide adenylyltransferase/Nudix hydroxylase [Novosphingobium sp. ERN07]|uniref:bifunctional nicotinamide-nucleotide adenylyltransferase/Nudix hydroxylase n=1 Tax=Novosphingobium sp. ERN07 TaxID=2726187 RepID=UPI0014576421|nr:bifunctional nicotinamide-nucleotide adenylyltransferase/Nudix hydroxylase [Novosphingobium sp. ERN07]NLR73014.1 bifunctional nicotinamide-nucleotide adenylyltransferase/Nudix hydroxylase [Novosphingobium sp. ERN07]